MGFSRTEYLEWVPFPSPGDLPNTGIKPRSPTLQADSLPAEPQGKPKNAEVGCLSLLQRIFLTQELNWSLLHCRWILYQLSYEGSPEGKEPAYNAGDPSSIPGLGSSPEEGIVYPLQYSWASLVAQLVKNPLAIQETWVGKIPWRRERQPTPVFWHGEFHGLCSPWGHKELDTTE